MLAPPQLRSKVAKLYFAALVLCPPAFRREFSMEMALDLEEAIEDAKLVGRRRELLALCAIVGTDLVKTLLLQWLRTGVPALFFFWTIGAIGAARLAGHVLPRDLFPVPAATAEREFVALTLLIGGVLFVVFATILFSFWFSGPLLRRHRR